MQIGANTTGMEAGISVATDKMGRESFVVVVKGTFSVHPDRAVVLAKQQDALVYSDVPHGDPGTTGIRYECDFAPRKLKADIIVNGHAIAPGGAPVRDLVVTLEVGSVCKRIQVHGDRAWERGVHGFHPSVPAPFMRMPLRYERAFGGSDHSHHDPSRHRSELRNPIGVGFHANSDAATIARAPLPNLEDPGNPIRAWSDTPKPMSFGAVGRGWQPRIRHAGTYDSEWLDARFPYLPEDFDERYFQSAPEDQQTPHLRGGERVRCRNMTPEGSFQFVVPELGVPLLFCFRDREFVVAPPLDTLIIEPDAQRFLLGWRAAVPVGRKLNALREVLVGAQPGPASAITTGTKPHFRSLADLARWRQGRG